MEKISKHLKDNLQGSLLGRLKLLLYQQITGKKDYLPAPRQFREFILEQYSFNSEVGKLFALLLDINYPIKLAYNQLGDTQDVRMLLSELQSKPLDPHFVELIDCPEPLPEIVGIFTYPRGLGDNGWVYVITLFDEEAFLEYFLGRLEIRAYQAEPEPAFAILNQEKFDDYNLKNYQENFLVALIVKVLNYVNKNREKQFISWEELKNTKLPERRDVKPPSDVHFMKAIQRVVNGLDKCTRAKVKLAQVKPHDFDFCMSYPLALVDKIVSRIKRGQEIDLIVYWNCQFTGYTTPVTYSKGTPVNYTNTAPLYGQSAPLAERVTRLSKMGITFQDKNSHPGRSDVRQEKKCGGYSSDFNAIASWGKPAPNRTRVKDQPADGEEISGVGRNS